MPAIGSRLRAAALRVRSLFRRSRALRVAAVLLGSLLLIGTVVERNIDGVLRQAVERRINQRIVGYTARVGGLDCRFFGLALDLKNVLVFQNAHPDPPVLSVPRLRLGVHWRDLAYLRLVADALFENPTVHLDLVQLREENRDLVPVQRRGWQRALQSIYPLKINELRVVNGTVAYQDDSGFRPLLVSELEFLAGNIQNIRAKDRQYPSTLHAEAWVFDAGRAVIDGHANFLAEPTPGVQGRLDLDRVELSYFEPIVRRFGLTARQGFFSGSGTVEIAPGIQTIDVDSVVITAAAVDYLHSGAPTPDARKAGPKISRVAREALNNPEVLYRVRHLRIDDGTLGIVNRMHKPPYRLYFSNADFELSNLSSRAEDGPAQAALKSTFMGSGSVDGNGIFYPEGKDANFQTKLAIRNTRLEALNDLLRARGKFDVSKGTFSLYSEVRVRDGYIDGYVKPIFRDIEVYDSKQDKHKNLCRKMYEGLVGGIAKLLENRRGEVVTVASLTGPVDHLHATTCQVLGGLLRNAFGKAILPGFEREIARLEPLKYRAAKKKERKAETERMRWPRTRMADG